MSTMTTTFWLQGMMAGMPACYLCIKADVRGSDTESETEFG